MKEQRSYKLGRKIAENILETGNLMYNKRTKANFFRGLIRGLMNHDWIGQIIEEEQKLLPPIEKKNHCHPKPKQILDGKRAYCKIRCNEKHRKECNEVYTK